MKINIRIISLFCALMFTAVLARSALAQSDEARYVFVVFETTVTRAGVETSDANPQERRFYVSNVVAFPDDPGTERRASKIADEYFIAAVSGPLKATKGIEHQYYDDAIHINNSVVYRLDTKREVEELQKKTIEELKGRRFRSDR